MSFNIVDLVKDQVKGQLIGHMGNLLGNEGGKATSAVDSMIPALLNGMTGSASTEEGANNLFGAIQNQDDSLLDNMGSMLGGGQAATVVDNGNSVLSGLFGSGGLGKLAGALSAFSGVSKGGTSSLMGMLAPVVLGVLKRKVMGDGLNASGLSSMLSSQSNNISASMPQGLGDQLNASGLLSSLGGIGGAGAGAAAGAAGAVAAGASNLAGSARDAAGSAVNNVTGAVGDVAGNARDGVANAAGAVGDSVSNVAGSARDGVGHAADAMGDGAKKGGSMFRWLLPIVALGALAWAALNFLPGSKDAATDAAADATAKAGDGAAAVAEAAGDATEAATDAAASAVDATKDAVEGATEAATDAAASATDAVAGAFDPEDVKSQLGGIFSGATETLEGITDLDSANNALPALGELGENVDSFSGVMDKIPEAARGPFTGIISGGMEQLQPMVDKVMGLPGVGDVVGPVLTPIMEKLQGFAG